MNPCAKNPVGGRVAGTENGQSERGRRPAATAGRDRDARARGVPGVASPGWRAPSTGARQADPGRRSRGPPPSTPRAAAAAAAAEPRKRAGISCARPASARWAAVSACRWLRGRRLRRSTGRRGGAGGAQEGGTGPQAKPTGVSGDGLEGLAARGRDAWLPGAVGGGPVTRGGGEENRRGLWVAAFPWGRPH